MSNCQTYLLSETVDQLFIAKQISKKKYYASYMAIAKLIWQRIFRNTIWSVQSRWMTLKQGDPYNYIDVPEGASRILSVAVEDKKCGLIQPLFYNNQLNIISKPKHRKCGCQDPNCTCESCCEAANSMTYTTKLLFTISGVDYYEKCWQELCKNGYILEYCETPTKKYNNTTGDSGDYNNDYNPDYLIGSPPFSDFTIEYVESQKKICKLEVAECGCPKETIENESILVNVCGCNLNFGSALKHRHCKQYEENINNNHLGEIKLSECGSKIYYKPSRHWRNFTDKKFPEFLLVNYQTNGLGDSEVLVPDYAINAMQAGINWQSIRFNSSIPNVQKQDAYYQFEAELSDLIMFLNPISLIELGKVQDSKIVW